jgi:hypothetical protein
MAMLNWALITIFVKKNQTITICEILHSDKVIILEDCILESREYLDKIRSMAREDRLE